MKMITLNQVMVATDFSDHSAPAVRYAVELAEPFGAEVVGCHILEPMNAILQSITRSDEAASMDVRASKARETMETLLAEAGAGRFRVLIEKGNSQAEIVRVAKNEDVDLIVLSTHGHGGMTHLLLGSTAEHIVRHATCPVLVVREGAHGFVQPTSDSAATKRVSS